MSDPIDKNVVPVETNLVVWVCWNDARASASSDASASCYSGTEYVRVLAMVMAERKFIQIQGEIFLTYVMVRATIPRFRSAQKESID